jgi:hypothetical protein
MAAISFPAAGDTKMGITDAENAGGYLQICQVLKT